MGRRMHAESPRFRDSEYSAEKCAQTFDRLLANDYGVVLVAESNGEVVGMMAGFALEHFFSTDITASDVVVYVVPEARGTSAAARLIRAFEQWAVDKGASEIMLGVSTEVHSERTAAFYGRLGYPHSGHVVLKRLRYTQGPA